MRLVAIDYETVRRDNDSGPATKFNTCFCDSATLPQIVDVPSPTPYAFSRWLPCITESRGLAEEDVQVVKLTQQQALLIVEASTASILTGVISRIHREDLEDVVYPAFSTLKYPAGEKGLFMRLDGCSPKDATCRLHNGFKPQSLLLSTEDIVLRLASSERAVKDIQGSLNADLTEILVFFLPFDPRMRSDREYRVFCAPRSGHISAISQYQWHKPWKFKDYASDPKKMDSLVERISKAAQELQQTIVTALQPDHCEEDRKLLDQGFSFDVFYDEDTGKSHLVELNVFGARSGLGSCLFDWPRDFDLLYGENGEEAQFRVTF